MKISTTCVCKEYEIKIKMTQEQWLQLVTTVTMFFIGLKHENCYLVGEN